MAENSPFTRVDRASLLNSPQAIEAFLGQLTEGVPSTPREGDSEPCFAISTRIYVQPIDDEFQADGEVYTAVTRRIGRNGVTILDPHPPNCEYLAMCVTTAKGEQLQFATHLKEWRQRGTLYEKRCEFLVEPNASKNLLMRIARFLVRFGKSPGGHSESARYIPTFEKLEDRNL